MLSRFCNGLWLASPGGAKFSKPIEEMSKEESNVCLKCFYTSARKKDGTYYKSSSTKSIRAAIDRFLRSPPHNKPFSIITDPALPGPRGFLLFFIGKFCDANRFFYFLLARSAESREKKASGGDRWEPHFHAISF